jgi:membrane-bound lytic murein transglycosylase D
MNFQRYSVCLSACAVCAVALIAGCVPAATKIVVPPSPPVIELPPVEVALEETVTEFVAPVEPKPEPEPEEPLDEFAGMSMADISALLESARAAAADSLHARADTVMRRVSYFLMRNSLDYYGQPLPVQNYVADIISVYSELMPREFAAPEEISVLIFSQHLLETLMDDSVRISPRDSVFLARLFAKREVVYDVPMVWNDRVRRALLFYLRSRNGVFDRWLHRAGYYLPVMTQMFADSGLPRDLAYLPIIESGFNPHAYSRAHAAGIWQFIPSTGRNYGLRQNYWIDERRDPIRSTTAAIAYLTKLYRDFGDWHIALASYNCGENGMARAIRRADGLRDYWQLQLPKETMNYIPLYLASLIIAKNPEVFDFAIQDSVVFNPDTVYIGSSIQLTTIAEGIGLPLDTIVRRNPHILHWATPPDMKNVLLYFPPGYGDKFREFYRGLPDEKKTRFFRYRVQSGDNLQQIARNFRVPIEAIREINGMQNNNISAGRFLIIPIPVGQSIPPSLAAHLNTTDRQQQRAVAQQRSRMPTSGSAPPRAGGAAAQQPSVTSIATAVGARQLEAAMATPNPSGRRISYKVRTGETLHSIATTFGVSVNDLMAWNYISNPRNLKAEQTLVIFQREQAAPPRQESAQRLAGTASGHTGQHLVKQGETLYGISRLVGVSVNELARINGLNPRRPQIFPGDVLVFTPPAGGAANRAAAAQSANQNVSQSAQTTAQQPSGPVVIYTVRPGDNLWRIALNFGVTVDSIRNENNLAANTVLRPGDILRITRDMR